MISRGRPPRNLDYEKALSYLNNPSKKSGYSRPEVEILLNCSEYIMDRLISRKLLRGSFIRSSQLFRKNYTVDHSDLVGFLETRKGGTLKSVEEFLFEGMVFPKDLASALGCSIYLVLSKIRCGRFPSLNISPSENPLYRLPRLEMKEELIDWKEERERQ